MHDVHGACRPLPTIPRRLRASSKNRTLCGLAAGPARIQLEEDIAIAKRKGVYDRAPKLTAEQIEGARQRIAADVPKAKVARDFGVSRRTLYTALGTSGSYAELAAVGT